MQLTTNCSQLKLKSSDGKYYNQDVLDTKGILRLIESIPSKNAEPFKIWLAQMGKERIDEVFDPSLTVQRAIDTYRAKGYDEEWIIKRIKGIQDRKKLTDVWNSNGVTEEVEYAILTNEIYREWSGLTAKQYKQYKGLRKESLRDKSHRPLSQHPNAHTEQELKWIRDLHRRNPHISVCELYGKLRTQKGYRRHPGSLYRVFVRLGYTSKAPSTKR